MSDVRIVLLGPPGAGKGTQGAKIESVFGIDHIATGDILRANKEMETDHGTPGEYMDAGELVPDPVMKEVVEEALGDRAAFVLDGYPRTTDQAEHLDAVAAPDLILHLDVGREELVTRLSGRRIDPETGDTYHTDYDMPDDPIVRDRLVQREDDEPERVQRRLDVYDEETAPLIDYYQGRDGYVRIDGDGTPDEVFSSIEDVLVDHGESRAAE